MELVEVAILVATTMEQFLLDPSATSWDNQDIDSSEITAAAQKCIANLRAV